MLQIKVFGGKHYIVHNPLEILVKTVCWLRTIYTTNHVIFFYIIEEMNKKHGNTYVL